MQHRIIGVKFSPGGLTGMTITYESYESKGNMKFPNEVTKKVKWPVQGELMRKLEQLVSWCAPVEGYDLEATGWKLKGDSIILSGLMSADFGDGPVYGGISFLPIGESHSGYMSLVEHINETEELIREYMTTKSQLNTRQMVLGLFDAEKIKGTTKTREEIEAMSDEEQLEFAKATMEKFGIETIDREEITGHSEEEDEGEGVELSKVG